ncbi:MAG: tetratricopeptide repeat protein [Clostridia bacterium]|nr:tetratricopeptide repeat protein [Clostridia bacterium]
MTRDTDTSLRIGLSSGAERALREASALMSSGREREALAVLHVATQCKETSACAHNKAGICYARLGDLGRARREFEAAIAGDHDSVDAYLNLGSVQLDMGDVESAVTTYGKAIQIEPGNVAARYNLMSTIREKPVDSCLDTQSTRVQCSRAVWKQQDSFRSLVVSRFLLFLVIAAAAVSVIVLQRR